MEDDVYNGMFIPKGSVIIPNTRYVMMYATGFSSIIYCAISAFTWDESKFHNPKVFNPDRFLPKPQGGGEVLSANVFWGWGRRYVSLHQYSKG